MNQLEEDSVGKPLYSRFIKTNDFKGVPHPLSGDYTPKPQEEIDESFAGSIGTSSEHSVDLEYEISRVPQEVTNINSVRPNINTGRVNVNSVRPNVNTGRVNVNSVRPNVNTGRVNVNSVKSNVNIELLFRAKRNPGKESSNPFMAGSLPKTIHFCDSLKSDEDSFELIELMILCTNFLTMILDLENTKTSEQSEIASLKRRSLGDDASKQGRIDIDDINTDVEITLIDETQGG
ncbi:hypothetical protein Tco_1023281 [Tanacetum coccineum]